MGEEGRSSLEELKAGQLWKTQERFLQVMDVGKTLVHYRILRSPNQKVSATRVANQGEMIEYLKRNKASLFDGNSKG